MIINNRTNIKLFRNFILGLPNLVEVANFQEQVQKGLKYPKSIRNYFGSDCTIYFKIKTFIRYNWKIY